MVYDAPMTRGVALFMMALGGRLRLRWPRQDRALRRAAAQGRRTAADGRTALPAAPPASAAPSTTSAVRPAKARATRAKSPPGMKRFEFRTGRGFELESVTIDGKGTLTKDTVDGRAELRLRRAAARTPRGAPAHRGQGQGAGHPPAPARHRVRQAGRTTGTRPSPFACGGGNGPCIKEDMKQWFDKARAVERGIFDKCGSTRVEGIRWSVEHSPEQTLEDLTLDFVLHIYKFEPRFVHGTPTCKGISGGKGAEEETMQGGAQGAVIARAVVAVALLALAPSMARAQAAWLRDRLDVEWVVATGGWRSAISATDQRAPGFDALAGGGEFVLGLDVGAGLAVVGDGRVLAGEAGGAGHTFFEALGSLALQLRARARALARRPGGGAGALARRHGHARRRLHRRQHRRLPARPRPPVDDGVAAPRRRRRPRPGHLPARRVGGAGARARSSLLMRTTRSSRRCGARARRRRLQRRAAARDRPGLRRHGLQAQLRQVSPAGAVRRPLPYNPVCLQSCTRHRRLRRRHLRAHRRTAGPRRVYRRDAR